MIVNCRIEVPAVALPFIGAFGVVVFVLVVVSVVIMLSVVVASGLIVLVSLIALPLVKFFDLIIAILPFGFDTLLLAGHLSGPLTHFSGPLTLFSEP